MPIKLDEFIVSLYCNLEVCNIYQFFIVNVIVGFRVLLLFCLDFIKNVIQLFLIISLQINQTPNLDISIWKKENNNVKVNNIYEYMHIYIPSNILKVSTEQPFLKYFLSPGTPI